MPVFSTIGGGYPADVEAAVDAQVEAGISLVTDGRETVPADADAAAILVADLRAGRGSGAAGAWGRASRRVEASSAGGTATIAAAPTTAATVPGPWSLAASLPGLDPAMRRSLAVELADAVGAEVAALHAAGCALVRVDEPFATDATAAEDAAVVFATAHRVLCRRARAGEEGGPHLMLALTGGPHETIGAGVLAGLAYASFLFDLVRGPDDWRVLATLPGDHGVVCGVVDPASSIGDAPEILVWAAHYAASTGGRGLARVGLSTTGSLGALGPDAAAGKLRAVVEGARIAALPRDELAASLDPRALDMRSAGVGAWAPDPRLDPRRRGT
jgi:methionine synthase II (cobalamin-independent)